MVDDLSERTGSPRRAMSVQEIVERMPGDDGGVADAGNPDDHSHRRFERRQPLRDIVRKPWQNSQNARITHGRQLTAGRLVRSVGGAPWQRARPSRAGVRTTTGAAAATPTRGDAGRQSQKNGLQTRIFVTHRAKMR
ncbi:MAG: hypothetical protein KA788_13250 [Lacunisphaera sp.]|nr:hypothetical protein [Lacunisphaera sp.]